jgi:hypothetical protein
MKTTTLLSLVSVAFISLAQPMWARGGGGGHFGGGGAHFGGGARSGGGTRHFGGGPRFGGGGLRSYSRGPRSSSFGTRQPQIRQRAFAGSNRKFSTPSARSTRTFNGRTGIVAERHGANWHRGWDRRHAHFFHNRFFVFNDGFWFGYPYDYYGYPYDYYAYDDDQGYNGYNETADPYSDATVSAVQSQLARQGYYRGVVDGVYGPQTRAALTRYQSNHGLQVTGNLTPATLQALGLS